MEPGIATRGDGREDLRRAVAELADRLPDALEPLARLAFNYRWSWLAGGPELFRAVDPERFELCGQNPVRLLQEVSSGVLRRAAGDRELLERAAALEAQVRADGTKAREHVGAELPDDFALRVVVVLGERDQGREEQRCLAGDNQGELPRPRPLHP